MAGDVVCVVCHLEFKKDINHIHEAEKFGWKQFCSLKCQKLYRRTGKELICDNPRCNKTFYRKLGEYKESFRHFCSSRCAVIVNNQIRSVNKRTKKCANPDCRNLILSARTFCSRACFGKCSNLMPPNNKIDKKYMRKE